MSFPGQEYFFSHGHTYKISSVIDGGVLDVSGGKAKDGAKMVTWDYHGGDGQRFQSISEGNGFRIEPKLEGKKGKVVLDYDTNKGVLGLWTFNGNINQQWIVEPVPDGNGAVIISSLENRNCLRNQGHGNQVKLSPRAFEDRSIWWYLTRLY